MLRYIPLLFSFLFLYVQLPAQVLKVISESSGKPIENVAIYSTSQNRSTITDSLGISGAPGFLPSDTVVFQHPSFVSVRFCWKDLAGKELIALVPRKVLLKEYVISANKVKALTTDIPYMIALLDSSRISASDAPTAADILEETGEVSIQRTQGGGGSPVLRGMEANRILLVIDGVRMNNAIYRSGHLQNALTIDPLILERTEIIFGPVSTMYGSDALGGVVHYYTRDPQLASSGEYRESINGSLRLASASSSYTGHLDFTVAGDKWGSLTSITYKNLGDIRMGAKRNPFYGDYGLVLDYVAQVNGLDSTLSNPNPLVQLNTGYTQTDLLQKFRFSPNTKTDWLLNLQYSTSSDIDRLDMLNNYKDGNLQYAEYYYGPQNRLLVSLKHVYRGNTRLFTTANTIFAVQKIDEDRYTRKFRSDELMVQQEDVMVYTLTSDLNLEFNPAWQLNYGLDFSFNTVESTAWYENIYTWEYSPADTRYPNLGSSTFSGALYGSLQWKPADKIILTAGSRYGRNILSSRLDYDYLDFNEVKINNGALTGSLSMVYHPTRQWQLNTILSTGFRNPNVDDYGKIRAKNGEVTVPNNQIKPEYSYNAEIGIRRNWGDNSKLEITAYYTLLVDAIVRSLYQLNGSDSLLYDGDYYTIVTNTNASRAYIYGATANLRAGLGHGLVFTSSLNYTRGRILTDGSPMGHIPPVFGRSTIRWEEGRYSVEAWLAYNGWKYIEDFSLYDEDNNEEATEYGFPSWWTANIRASVKLYESTYIQLSVENIFDQFYKTFASGVASPGRNFVITLRQSL